MMRWLNEFVGVNINSERVVINGPLLTSGGSDNKGQKKSGIYVIGDVYGAYVDGRSWDPGMLMRRLVENGENEAALEKILRKSVGDFFIVALTEKKALILTTPGCHGIFYTSVSGKIIISDLPEGLFPLINSYTVSDYEVLQWLIMSGERSMPFRYIFKEIRCLMGGSRLSVSDNGAARTGVYIFPPTEPNCTYEMYVDGLEGTAKVIVAECTRRNKPIYSLFSGGIDSTTTALSIMSAGGKVTPITLLPSAYRDLEGYEVTYALATRSSEAIGAPLRIIPFDEFDETAIDRQFGTFGSCLYSGGYLGTAFFKNPRLFGDADPLVFSADGMDTIYAIAYQKPPFKLPVAFQGFHPALNPGYLLGMQYTGLFQSAVLQATPFWRWAYPILHRRRYMNDIKLPLNAYEYILNMILSTKHLALHSDRLLTSILASKGGAFYASQINSFLKTPAGRKFAEYKFQTVIKEMLENANLSDLKINNLSLAQFNSIIRRLAYSTFFWQGLIGQYASAQKFNYGYFSFPMQGPLLDVFSGLYAGLKEITFPKWFEYRYFKQRVKKRYSFISVDSLPSGRNERSRLPVVNHRDLFIKSRPYIDRMLPLMNSKQSALLDLLKDDDIREFVRCAYEKAREAIHDNADAWPMFDRLYQLESHIRHVMDSSYADNRILA
ncbi:MAG: hypothetical protein PHO42_04735 [Candidatus Omnitrophica bacterium]|nr:hypothetical protein [Candidatus Omnitrophota bacterium]